MRALLRDTHLYHGAVANGGFYAINERQYLRIAEGLSQQYQYLNRLEILIRTGTITRPEGLARAALFARSALIAFGLETEQAQIELGRRQERNRLGIGEHCVDCVAQSALQWVEIGTLIPIGRRRCRGNCRCYIEYGS